jgi:hypothetical protein
MGDDFRSGMRCNDSGFNRTLYFPRRNSKQGLGTQLRGSTGTLLRATVRGGFDVTMEANSSASLVLTKAGIVDYIAAPIPT